MYPRGVCEKACRTGAIEIHGDKLTMDASKCNYCGRCVKACPFVRGLAKALILSPLAVCLEIPLPKGMRFFLWCVQKNSSIALQMQPFSFLRIMPKRENRFKFTLDRVGRDVFKKVVREAYDGKVEE